MQIYVYVRLIFQLTSWGDGRVRAGAHDAALWILGDMVDGFKWSPAFETGEPEIDKDHRALFALANSIGEDVGKRGSCSCSAHVKDFIDLAERHFAKEEKILARFGFPDLEAHKVYHASLLAQANRLKQVCDAATDPEAAEACYGELVAFLVDDIVRGDSQFKSYLDHHGFIAR